jgi:pimeloyl-ACP methyl ester carboxylesterase
MGTDLHVVEFGQGEPIVFVHGSFDCAEETFPNQRELADQYRVVLVDRRGYGESPPAVRFDFDSQVDDLIAVLGSGAHLVGQSYGGVLCLLAAARRPDLVWSLTVIEPPAFSVARGDPSVERFIERLQAWVGTAVDKPRERLVPDFLAAFGLGLPTDIELSEQDFADAVTSAHEPPPWQAEVPLDRLGLASLPTLKDRGLASVQLLIRSTPKSRRGTCIVLRSCRDERRSFRRISGWRSSVAYRSTEDTGFGGMLEHDSGRSDVRPRGLPAGAGRARRR